MRIGENGDPYIDMSNLTTDQAIALRKFTVEDFKDAALSKSPLTFPPCE